MKTWDVDQTIDERGSRYGKFVNQAELAQKLKDACVVHAMKHEREMEADQWEAIEMILHKIARIINGDPNYADSWHDIGGYAKLVEDRLNGIER